jgi:hypothetical protein
MQALSDFQDLRAKLRNALIARDTMRNASLPQPRRDLGTQAYTQLVDQIINLLEQLEFQPMRAGPASKPTLTTLEEVLSSIARADTELRARGVNPQPAE